jgi:hypothetical protein
MNFLKSQLLSVSNALSLPVVASSKSIPVKENDNTSNNAEQVVISSSGIRLRGNLLPADSYSTVQLVSSKPSKSATNSKIDFSSKYYLLVGKIRITLQSTMDILPNYNRGIGILDAKAVVGTTPLLLVIVDNSPRLSNHNQSDAQQTRKFLEFKFTEVPDFLQWYSFLSAAIGKLSLQTSLKLSNDGSLSLSFLEKSIQKCLSYLPKDILEGLSSFSCSSLLQTGFIKLLSYAVKIFHLKRDVTEILSQIASSSSRYLVTSHDVLTLIYRIEQEKVRYVLFGSLDALSNLFPSYSLSDFISG